MKSSKILSGIIHEVKKEVLNIEHYKDLSKNKEILKSVLLYCSEELDKTNSYMVGDLVDMLHGDEFDVDNLNYIYKFDAIYFSDVIKEDFGQALEMTEEEVKKFSADFSLKIVDLLSLKVMGHELFEEVKK